MSASLVGSEMCIRDSPTHFTTSTAPLPSPSPQSSPPLKPPLLTHSSPVSYTHLTLPTICSV
eukprot:8907174-Alexandrium_andersonii.AAC.1